MKLHELQHDVQSVILEMVFEGDPHQWLQYLLSKGSPSQRLDDLQFVLNRICSDQGDGRNLST